MEGLAGNSYQEKILIVDDLPMHLEAAGLYLQRAGFDVYYAADIETAWRLVRDERPQLVFLDVVLAEENGLDLLAKIKARCPQIAVVVVTAYGSEETAARALRLGADDYVRKPLKYSMLPEVAEKVLARQREQLEKEQAAQKLSDEYKALQLNAECVLHSLSSGVIAVDESLYITMINQKAMKLFNVGQEVVGRYYYDVFPGFKKYSLLVRTLRHGKKLQVYGMEYGCGKVFDVHTEVIKNHCGGTAGAVIIFDDITDLRRLKDAARQKEELAVIGQMAAGIAHELKNPLTAIKGFGQMIAARGDDCVKRYMEVMNSEIERMQAVIENFLQLGKPVKPKFVRCSLNEVLKDMVPLIKSQAYVYVQGIDVKIITDPAVPEALIDVGQIKQLLLNLVQNAVEAMPDGGQITLETKYYQEEKKICLKVADNGCGIAPDDLEKIGTAFYTTKSYGTGLGLSICQSIVERHGGSMKVESTPGEGSTFLIYLPADTARQ